MNYVSHKSRASVMGISESKIDDSVLDGEITIDGYIWSARNRQGGGVSATLGKIHPLIELTSNPTLNTSF